MAEQVTVEVVLALPGEQFVRKVTLSAGATVQEAVAASAIDREFSGTVDAARFGIFSRPAEPDRVVRDGDRIEIYRPLTLDPKEARRRRARNR